MALLPSDPKEQRKLLIGLAPIVALFAYWYFFHGAKVEELTAMETHLEELETKNATARAQMNRGGPDLERRVALYEQYMAQIEELIPQREEVPQLLHSMTDRAQENGVELTLMRPQDEIQETFYTRALYDVAAVGTYHDVGRYLAALGSLPRIVAPMDVQVSGEGIEPGRGGVPRISASFRIQTFVVPPEGTVPPDTVAPNARG